MLHPFDHFIALAPTGQHQWSGQAQAPYWNMVGPFGGVLAAVATQAVMLHPERLGEPISISANFCAAMGHGVFDVKAQPVRTNRSTQHWLVEVNQPDAQGHKHVILTATLVTAVRRTTWSVNDCPMPNVPHAHAVPRPTQTMPVEWINRYDMRQIEGSTPGLFDNHVSAKDPTRASFNQLWVRDNPPRALDFCSLTALADVFYPRIWLRRRTRVPVGTVSMTVYFHADTTTLSQVGDDYLLGQARGQVFYNGFSDQTAMLWASDGTPLASTHQTMYYKE